jgi:threonine/homoserine/homoserine lactone efflux protein
MMEPLASAFVAGIFAGYGVAIPVGAIAVLIIDTALRRGFVPGLAAGAGAATADGLYALVAALAGAAVAALVAPLSLEVRAVSALVLALIAIRGLISLRAIATAGPAAATTPRSLRRTYLTILALTIVNPMTVIYFTALILGLPAIGSGPDAKAAFVIGAFLASLSWQSVLAALGSVAHRRLPERARLAAALIGDLIVLGFALNIARGLVPA